MRLSVAAAVALLGLCGCTADLPAWARDPVRSWGALAHDGTFVYWRQPGGNTLLRLRPDGGVQTWLVDAGPQPGLQLSGGHALWVDDRVMVRPLDGGPVRSVGPRSSSSRPHVHGNRVALRRNASEPTPVELWDFTTGAHLESLAPPDGHALGFTSSGDMLSAQCWFRRDDAGLELAVGRASADGGVFEPWARASCPTETLVDGDDTYLNDYTPGEGVLQGTTVLRRLDPSGATTRLAVEETLFVRGGVAFRVAEWHWEVLHESNGPIRLPDGGLLQVLLPGAIEAVSLSDGGVTRVVALRAAPRGFAVDGQSSFILYDDQQAVPTVAPLPENLRSP